MMNLLTVEAQGALVVTGCLPSPLGVQVGKHEIPSPGSAALKTSIKTSALLQHESEKLPSPSAAFPVLFGPFSP